MEILATKLQSTKVLIAVGIFATATALLVLGFVPAEVWETSSQTVLIGYAMADVAAKFAPK